MKNVEQEVKSWIEKKIIYCIYCDIFIGNCSQNYAAKVCIKGCPNIFASMV